MKQTEFEEQLRERFADPPVPASLEPQKVMERLREHKPALHISAAKRMAIAAGLVLAVGVSIFAVGVFQPVQTTEDSAQNQPYEDKTVSRSAAVEPDAALFTVPEEQPSQQMQQEKQEAQDEEKEQEQEQEQSLPSDRPGCLPECTREACVPECPNYSGQEQQEE